MPNLEPYRNCFTTYRTQSNYRTVRLGFSRLKKKKHVVKSPTHKAHVKKKSAEYFMRGLFQDAYVVFF